MNIYKAKVIERKGNIFNFAYIDIAKFCDFLKEFYQEGDIEKVEIMTVDFESGRPLSGCRGSVDDIEGWTKRRIAKC